MDIIELDKIHTSCKNCVFAEMKNGTQIGCKVDKLRDFDDVIEAEDDEEEFYVINRAVCLWKRSGNWAMKREGQNLSEEVMKELAFRYEAIIFIHEDNVESLRPTVDSLMAQPTPPTHIMVLQMCDNLDPFGAYDLLEPTGVKWRVEKMMMFREPMEYLDTAIANVAYAPYYLVLQAGQEVDPRFYDRVNHLVARELKPFMCITGEYELYMRLAHALLGGNKEGLLKEKIDDNLCLKLSEILQE